MKQPKTKKPAKKSADQTKPDEKQNAEPNVKYSISGGFVDLLNQLNISVAVSSYQSGRLYLLGRNLEGGLMVNEQYFQKAMGLHYHDKTLYMATLANIYEMRNILRENEVMDNQFTDCFMPRKTHMTGALDTHDIGVTKAGETVFVNTRYNCIATVSDVHSFKPLWKPDFVSAILSEDRCHLNGMAMQDGEPRYASAISKSDTIDGWRDRRASGGIVMDIKENKIICEGLSMPHSPRVYDDEIWVLNSGTGELGTIEPPKKKGDVGTFDPLCFCPGFVRGLAFHGKYAFVGLSKPRYERFEGLPLDDRLKEADSEAWCGVQVIDLNTGTCVQWFRIDGSIGELYDVEIIPDTICPRSYGFLQNDVYGIVTIEDRTLS